MNPNSSIETTKAAYKKIYNEYASRNSELNSDVKEMIDKFISKLNGENVLDIGCANGRESKYLSGKGLNVTGCDLTEEFISLAKLNCPGCDFIVRDMRNLGLSENYYDGLWVSASFLHIPKINALETLIGFNDVLKKGGVLYISVMGGEFEGLRPNTQLNWPERHFSDYKEEEFNNLLLSAGFIIDESKTTQTSWGPQFLHYFCNK